MFSQPGTFAGELIPENGQVNEREANLAGSLAGLFTPARQLAVDYCISTGD